VPVRPEGDKVDDSVQVEPVAPVKPCLVPEAGVVDRAVADPVQVVPDTIPLVEVPEVLAGQIAYHPVAVAFDPEGIPALHYKADGVAPDLPEADALDPDSALEPGEDAGVEAGY